MLNRSGVLDYVELYSIPGSLEQVQNYWRNSGIPAVLHAPHASHGVNLADPEVAERNRTVFNEVQRFADILSTEIIIAHSGNGGTVDETVRQLRAINDPRICIENKPLRGLNGKICQGHSVEEISRILKEGKVGGFVLDFGHAFCAANSTGVAQKKVVEDFLALNPRLFHLSDGDRLSEMDHHVNLGKGSFDIPFILSRIPDGGSVSLETPRASIDSLEDFLPEVAFLRGILNEK